MSNCSVTGSINGTSPNLTPGEATATMDSLYDGLPAGTFYYTGDHLGSSSLVTNANGDEVLRIAYDSYGAVDLAQSGRLENGTLTLATDQAEYGILAVRFTGQEYDDRHGCLSVGGRMDAQEPTPETGLYYYNARYYDDRHGCLSVGVRMDAQEPTPQLGIFTTADNLVPYDKGDLNLTLYPKRDLLNRKKSDGKTKQIMQTGNMDMHRYMYVRGNPVKYTDPRGHEPKGWYDPEEWSFYKFTVPPWHYFTGPTNRANPKGDVEGFTALDDISKIHDLEGKLGRGDTDAERRKRINADLKFIVSFHWDLILRAQIISENLRKCTNRWMFFFQEKLGFGNPAAVGLGIVIGLFETPTQIMSDFNIGLVGSVLFYYNISRNILPDSLDTATFYYTDSVYHTALNIFGIGVSVYNGDFKELPGKSQETFVRTFLGPLSAISDTKQLEGRGRFLNWNRPWKWRFW